MSSNFINSLSVNYCNEFFPNAMFLYEGKPHLFSSTDGRYVAAIELSPDPKVRATKSVAVPASFFTGWASFSFPTLGYRQADSGQFLGYFSRRPSVRRGLNLSDVLCTTHDVSYGCAEYLMYDWHDYDSRYGKAQLIMCPSYTNLLEGLKDIKSGNIASFALSADFAVAPNSSVEYLEILFRQRRVGVINKDGDISLSVASLKPSWDTVIKGVN